MTNRFLSRAERELTRKLGQILYEIKDPRLDGCMAISRVSLSADLSHVKVYVVINEDPEKQEVMVSALRAATPFLRRRLGESIRLRKTPEIHIFHDTTPENAAHIESIIDHLKETGQIDISVDESEPLDDEPESWDDEGSEDARS